MKNLSILVSAALMCVAGAASASTVNLTNYTYLPPTPLLVTGSGSAPSYGGNAGQFTGTLDGASFTTYCTDLTQYFYFGTTYTDYSVVSGVSYWGAPTSTELDKLFSYGASLVYDSVSSAIFQAAVWEVIYETPGVPYSFAGGDVKVTSNVFDVQQDLNTADTLWAAVAAAPITVHVDKLYSATNQDFLVLTPVPEPETWLMFAVGLAGMGVVGHRRLRRD